ncbi:MAG TPA: glycogen debranching protein GlgX [Actinopolymorphaceae bacterium]
MSDARTALSPDGRPPLGATYDPATGQTSFALWAPEADEVEVCLFDDDRQRRVPLLERLHGIWFDTVPDTYAGQLYGFRVHGPWIPERGLRFNSSKLLVDPYARAVSGELVVDDAIFGYDAIRGDDTVRDLRDSAPFVPKSVIVPPMPPYDRSDRPNVPWGDTVVYELHVRGYTMKHPHVPERLRGTYAGLAHPAVLEGLVDLGVTTVELLPVHQFVSESWMAAKGLTNYWGYNTLGFFAPHAAYAASGTRGEQVEEFRAMVRAFHEAGLEIVLDVVFNHSCEQNELGPTLSFRGIHNRGYYRLFGGGRRHVDITGTGNTLDLREPRVIAMVTDSLRYWVEQMGVDGFRFDLAPVLARTGVHGGDDLSASAPLLVAIGQDPVLSKVKLIAEPWDVGPNGYWAGGFPPPWAEWNGRYRDDVRDFWRGASNGLAALGYRLTGSSDIFAVSDRNPTASVNFVTCHDGFTLRDVVSYDRKHNEANLEDNADGSDDNRSRNYGVEGETERPAIARVRRRQARNLLTTLLLSLGTPMLLAGDEFGRTQRGNNNAYCQDNEISWVDWSDSEWSSLREHVKAVLRLRREHPVFRRRSFFTGNGDIGWFRPDGSQMDEAAWHDGDLRTLGMFLVGDPSFLLWFNAAEITVDVKLPHGVWASGYEVVLDTSEEVTDLTPDALDTFSVPPRAVVVLQARRP